MKSCLSYSAILCAALFSTTAAKADPLNGGELRILLAGKTLHLSAPFGSLPIRYNAGGTMVARSKAMLVYAGVGEDRGSWRIQGNQVCQRWQIWNKGKEQCFSVSRDGNSVRWRSNDGMSGTAVASK